MAIACKAGLVTGLDTDTQRGDMELRFTKWLISDPATVLQRCIVRYLCGVVPTRVCALHHAGAALT
jgi:hypothetical protein